MTQNYTLDDLVRLIYKEASTTERLSMEIDLDRDYELREELKDLQFAASQLPKCTFAPSEKSIKNILDYSKLSAKPIEA